MLYKSKTTGNKLRLIKRISNNAGLYVIVNDDLTDKLEWSNFNQMFIPEKRIVSDRNIEELQNEGQLSFLF